MTGAINWADELVKVETAAPQQEATDWTSEILQTAAPAQKQPAQPKQQEQTWGEWAVNLPARAYKAAKGEHDPAYAGLKSFDDTPASDSLGYKTRTTVGMIGGMDDQAYGDIIQRSLGDKFIRRFKDSNGYELVEHKGPDGKPVQAYVNKPGLDLNDVSRGVVGALPYVAGGTWMAGKLGASTLPGVIAQGGVAGITSAAGDIATNSAGANRDFPDMGKAGLTAAFGAGGAAVAPLAGHLWRRFVTIPGLVDANGKLTAKGIEAAKRAGIDDASALEGEIAKNFAATYARTGKEAASAVSAESGAYGVETSLGQRTKDPMQLLREKGYRMGNYGEGAKQQITGLDQRQADQIERMMRGTVTPASKVEPSMLERIAPNKPYISTNPAALGTEIQTGVRAAKGAAKAEERAAWDAVPDLVPRQEAFADLAPMIGAKLGKMRLSTSTPKAMEMDAALADYAAGKAVASGTKLVNQSPVQTVDDMRRHLKDTLFAVDKGNAADASAAKSIYDGFNDWIKSSASKALLNGDADKAANLFKAVDLSREMNQIFKPAGQNFKPNAATRIMERVLDEATPERIVSTLFINPSTVVTRDGAVQALTSIKKGLERYTPQTASETWNAIRVAQYANMIEDAQGRLLSPTVMAKNIDAAISSHRTLMSTLYSPQEMREMMRISRVLKGAAWKDPNPSGTATANQGIFKEFFGTLMRALPIGNTARIAAEFSGLPNRARNAMGTVGAGNATSQALPTLTNPPVAGYTGTMGNQLYNQQ